MLDRIGDLLEAQEANPYRVRAYHRGARAVRGMPKSIAALAGRDGRAGLAGVEGIGAGLAAVIDEIVHTGDSVLLRRLEGQMCPEQLFATVPGIGPDRAAHIHRDLGIDTLEELEAAAHDGRLAAVPGFGPRRIEAARIHLDARLGRSSRRRARARHAPGQIHPPAPPVSLLLDLDRRYRIKSEAGLLPRIPPRRFNPSHQAWLPVWHTERGGWHFTLLYSNTARAHRLGKTRDWVVVFYDRDGDDDQCTIVSEHRGHLEGRRVVRGREAECALHYGDQVVSAGEASAWARAAAESFTDSETATPTPRAGRTGA